MTIIILSCEDGYLIKRDGSSYKKKYNTNSSFLEQILPAIIQNYEATSQYNSFNGQTQSGVEGRWMGYRHSNYGSCIVISRGRVFVLYLSTTNNITTVTKQRLLIDIYTD